MLRGIRQSLRCTTIVRIVRTAGRGVEIDVNVLLVEKWTDKCAGMLWGAGVEII